VTYEPLHMQPPKELFDPPALYSIHQGTVKGIHGFGAFVRLDGKWDKDALVHVTQLKASEEGERVETASVVSEGDRVWVKVIDIAWAKHKYFLSRKYVNQEDGGDLDAEQVELGKEKAKAAEQAKVRAEERASRAAAMMEQVAAGVDGAAGAAYSASPARNGKGSEAPGHLADGGRKERNEKGKGGRSSERDQARDGRRDSRAKDEDGEKNEKEKAKSKDKSAAGYANFSDCAVTTS
jgi:predicted RNA-binding protein with RPS1 domain